MQKRYRLKSELAGPFFRRGGIFEFRLGYSASLASGGSVLRTQRNGLRIETRVSDTVGVSNEQARTFLELFHVPQKSVRNGQKHVSGTFFEDVTATTSEQDVTVDIDLAIAAAEAARSQT